MPPVTRLPPEAGVPYKNLLLYRTQHDENNPQGGEPREDAEGYTQPAGQLDEPEEPSKAWTQSDALGPGNRVLDVTPTAADEDRADQESHE